MPAAARDDIGDLLRDRQRLVEWDRSARDALRQILALDEFHHERGHAIGFFETVDVGDVGMIERREDLGLALEARQSIAITSDIGGKDFQRDLALQLRVFRAIDLAHSARAEGRKDFVRAEAGAGGQSDARV